MSTAPPDTDHLPATAHRWPLDRTALFEMTGVYAFLSIIGIAMGSLAVSWSQGPDRAVDETAVEWWQAQRSPTLDSLTDMGSSMADTAVLGAIVAIVFLLLAFLWRRRRAAATLGLAMGFEVAVFLTVSTVVGRGRPEVEQLDPAPPTASFPSGHVGASAAFALIITVIVFWNSRRTLWRAMAVIGALTLTVVVALSRMYRGMHFLSDVVGGAMLGAAAAVAACAVVIRALDRKKSEEYST